MKIDTGLNDKSLDINVGIGDILKFTDARKSELRSISSETWNREVIVISEILLSLYDELECIFRQQDACTSFEDKEFMIALVQKEIEHKERRLRGYLSMVAEICIDEPVGLVMENPGSRDIYDTIIYEIDFFRSSIERYLFAIGEEKSKIRELIFENHPKAECENLSEGISQAMDCMRDYKARFCAYQFALALSRTSGITHMLKMNEMNSLLNELEDFGIKGLNMLPDSGSELISYDHKLDHHTANIYFFGLIKEFHKAMNGTEMIPGKKGYEFSEKVISMIKDRIGTMSIHQTNAQIQDH